MKSNFIQSGNWRDFFTKNSVQIAAPICLFVGVFLAIFSLKLWLIGEFANATPYWDQWDGEARSLFLPWLKDELSLRDLFAAHNEHRIVLTRLLSLSLLQINGFWDPVLEMTVQALIHAGCLAILCVGCARPFGPMQKMMIVAMAVILGGVPFGSENTLWGFQSQFYLVLLWGLLGIWIQSESEALSRRWFLGLFFLSLGLISMVGGLFALVAATSMNIVRFIKNSDARLKEVIGFFLLFALVVVGFLLMVHVEGHEPLKAQSVGGLLNALTQLSSWPSKGLVYALIQQLPVFCLVVYVLINRKEADPYALMIIALGAWHVLQMLGLAYGRGNVGAIAPRYMDTLAFGLIVQLSALLYLYLKSDRLPQWLSATAYGSVWVACVLGGVFNQAQRNVALEIEAKYERSLVQEQNVRQFIATGDYGHLRDKPFLDIPYPDADSLGELLSDEVLVEILPVNIRPPIEHSQPTVIDGGFVRGGIAPGMTKDLAEDVWGSMGIDGELSQGTIEVHYEGFSKTQHIELLLAGAVNSPEISVTVTDSAGDVHIVEPEENPMANWRPSYVKVVSGPFTITAKDHSESDWVAFSSPRPIGRFSLLTQSLLDIYIYLLAVSAGLLFAYFTYITSNRTFNES